MIDFRAQVDSLVAAKQKLADQKAVLAMELAQPVPEVVEAEPAAEDPAQAALLESLRSNPAYQQIMQQARSENLIDALKVIYDVFKPSYRKALQKVNPWLPKVANDLIYEDDYEWVTIDIPFTLEVTELFNPELGLTKVLSVYVGEKLDINPLIEGEDDNYLGYRINILFRVTDPTGPLTYALGATHAIWENLDNDWYADCTALEIPFEDLKSLIGFLAKALAEFEFKAQSKVEV
jgi:hypothetical protein